MCILIFSTFIQFMKKIQSFLLCVIVCTGIFNLRVLTPESLLNFYLGFDFCANPSPTHIRYIFNRFQSLIDEPAGNKNVQYTWYRKKEYERKSLGLFHFFFHVPYIH